MSVDEPTLLSVAVESAEGAARVIARGELDVGTVPQLESALEKLQANGRTPIVDLRELTFIDSTGLRCLLRAGRRAAPARLLVVRGPEHVQRVFELTKTEELLELVDDPADARGA